MNRSPMDRMPVDRKVRLANHRIDIFCDALRCRTVADAAARYGISAARVRQVIQRIGLQLIARRRLEWKILKQKDIDGSRSIVAMRQRAATWIAAAEKLRNEYEELLNEKE